MSWPQAAAVVALAALAGVCNLFYFLNRPSRAEPLDAPQCAPDWRHELEAAVSFPHASDLFHRVACDPQTLARRERIRGGELQDVMIDFAGRRWVLIDSMWQRAA